MSGGQTIEVVVKAIEQVTPLIKHFRLAAPRGEALPAFSGGSHVIVVMRGEKRVHRNPYSLLSAPQNLDTYEIAVRRMEESRGGSHFMHDRLQVGSRLEIAHPVNLFGLDKIARKHLMIAGGIGITPFLAQLEDLHGGTVPYELHYSVRSAEHAAFLARLQAREQDRVRIYYDSESQVIDFEGLLSTQPLGTHVYVCGPAGFIGRVIDTAPNDPSPSRSRSTYPRNGLATSAEVGVSAEPVAIDDSSSVSAGDGSRPVCSASSVRYRWNTRSASAVWPIECSPRMQRSTNCSRKG